MFHKIVVATLLVLPFASAHAMTVTEFLGKADALKAKGALALFSGDLKLLKSEVTGAAGQLRAERLAAVKGGRRPAYCPPEGGGQMDSDQIVQIMRAVPAPDRSRLQVKDALRAHFSRTYPCR
jgi:hypothetical protein